LKFIYWVVFFLFFVCVDLVAKPVLETLDTSNYPNVHLHIREDVLKPIQSTPLTLVETLNGKKRTIDEINILRKNQYRPINLLLSIHASEYENRNEKVKLVALSLVESLSETDKVGIQIYGNETISLDLGLNKAAAIEKIKMLTPAYGNKQNYNLIFLSENIITGKLPKLIVVLNISNNSVLDEPVEKISRLLKKEKIPVHIYGIETTANSMIVDATGGSFFSHREKTSFSNLKAAVNVFRKLPPIIEYRSPFAGDLKSPMPVDISLDFSISNKQYNLSYQASYLHILKSKFAGVEYFYGVAFLVLVFCIFILIFINKNIRSEIERNRLRQLEAVKKADLYYQENMRELKQTTTVETVTKPELVSKVNTVVRAYSDKSDDKKKGDAKRTTAITSTFTNPTATLTEYEIEFENNLPREELNRGEEYGTAVLIQKKGPNPGRQFTMHQDEIRIGSSPESELVLWDSFISAVHARIKKINNKYVIFDLYSSSGVYLNNKKLLRPKVLMDFDEIKLGKTVLIFRGK
jgi:hypothetical protein